MKNLLLISILLFSKIAFSQEQFTNCSAAFLDGKMIVKEYTDVAKAKISIDAKGELTVSTAELGENYSNQVKKFDFSVAIKDKNTGTMMLFSKNSFMKIEIEKVLTKCKKGDMIVILTHDDQYAVPHNDILVE